jgi:diaminopimelate epimerase
MARNLAFTKMTGAGNDFIVLERDELPAGDGGLPSPAEVAALCDRRRGIGADGLMLIGGAPAGGGSGGHAGGAAWSVDFFNADGSTGMLCGNGARCAIEYARLTGRAVTGAGLGFSFGGRPYRGESLGEGMARFELSPSHELREELGVEVDGLTMDGHFVDVGSLHFVVDIAGLRGRDGGQAYRGIEDIPVFELGKKIRWHQRFAPRGVNVNFIELRGDVLWIRTFERGVEDETLACGTGSTAAALAAWRRGLLEPPVRLRTRGGEELRIDIGSEGGVVGSLSLTGPARKVFEGRMELTS